MRGNPGRKERRHPVGMKDTFSSFHNIHPTGTAMARGRTLDPQKVSIAAKTKFMGKTARRRARFLETVKV